ncbi:hypothetical protein ULG90_04620 [Halopseudomonas pachastrellae]|nr:hypothetical protein ULG90_04620 [Halopseudomonas pachastrellae]
MTCSLTSGPATRTSTNWRREQAQLGYEFEHRFNETFSVQQNVRYGHTDTTNQYTGSSLQSGSTTILDRTAYGVYEQMNTVTTDTRLTLASAPAQWITPC